MERRSIFLAYSPCYKSMSLSPQGNMDCRMLPNDLDFICPRAWLRTAAFLCTCCPEERTLHKGQAAAFRNKGGGKLLFALCGRCGTITVTYFLIYSSSEFRMLAMWEATKFFTCSFCSRGRSWMIWLISDWEGPLISMR